ncbi:MAG: TPM domain-containing protein, partial [Pseudomonadota bacterium]|nr:TPM domain-containing protein [Pseudomonadota bacterium]
MQHFSPSALTRFQDIIAQGQGQHEAHVHLAIETSLSSAVLLAGCTPRQRARRLFAAHGIT